MESGHASPAETGNPTETHIPEAGEQGTAQEGGSLFHSVVFTEGQTIQESAEYYVCYCFHLLPRLKACILSLLVKGL